MEAFQLFPRVIDQGGQSVALAERQRVFKKNVDLFPNHAGSVFEYVEKGAVFSVYIADKMLRALGQAENGLEVDDLRGHLRDGGKGAAQQLQISEFQRGTGILHAYTSVFVCLIIT